MSWQNWPPQQAPMNANMNAQYTPEQWHQMQQQNWQQWAQWQQQYQQWHQQYGAEYQKSLGAMGGLQPQPQPPLPVMPQMEAPPPLPLENKPPPPPEEPPQPYPQAGPGNNRPLWPQQGNNNKRPMGNNFEPNKRQKQWPQKPDLSQAPPFHQRQYYTQPPPNVAPTTTPPQVAPKPSPSLDELSEAEKKFDKEFAAWEAQFNTWKQQNVNHPDKNQYNDYEKKWETWRNSLLERREQMRKKRLSAMGKLPPQQQQQQQDSLFNKPPPTFPANMANQSFEAKQPPQTGDALSGTEPGFLAGSTSDGIPGLDLVKDDEPLKDEDEVKPDIIELDKEERENKRAQPDFEAISKGINNILGDQKLLSMLSLVTQNPVLGQVVQPVAEVQTPQFNEHSSQDYNDRMGYQQTVQQSEPVNNFDDQTRSSFTSDKNRPNYNYNQNNSYQGGPHNTKQNENNSFRGAMPFKQRNRNVREEYDNYEYNNDNYEENYDENYDNYDNYEEPYQENEYYEGNGDNYNNEYEDENDYDKYHEWFNEEQQQQQEDPVVKEELQEEMDDGAIFEPSTVIDYEHKSFRKNGDTEITLEPVHMFDYRHKPLSRIPIPQRPQWLINSVRYIREFEPIAIPYDRMARTVSRRPQFRDEGVSRRPPREERRPVYNKETSKYSRAYSQPQTSRAQPQRLSEMKDMDFDELSDDDMDFNDEKPRPVKEDSPASNPPPPPISLFNNITMIEDLINEPGRFTRPPKLVIILRGPPGSGKTYLAKLIKDKEVEICGSAPRILSLDDYFMVEQDKEVLVDGKTTHVKEMVYEYEQEMEESYRSSLIKSFKKTITDGYFPFIIVDNINDKVKYFGEMWRFAKNNGFQVYVCQMDLDPQVCAGRNTHNRSLREIEDCVAAWEPTPSHHPQLDASNFLQGTVQEVEMEDVTQDCKVEDEDDEVEDHNRSKWDNFDCSSNNLAKLDGVSKPLRASSTMQEYLQLEDEPWSPPRSTQPGKKRVRWADLEQQKQHAKMKALGFVVGQRNWGDLMEKTGESALTQTKYIERVRKF